MTPARTQSLAALADGAQRLDSLPEVVVRLLRLTDDPDADARALCDCLESDPALAAKVLRALNSPLYGLAEPVASLPLAVALLGARPLRLLVLGFALPQGLSEGVTAGALRRYWSHALTTAAAARALAEAGWSRLADDALVAGLLQGIGRLALTSQLGRDYTRLIEAASRGPTWAGQPLAPLERDALGFDHRELSAELTHRWRLPERITDAIAAQATNTIDALHGDTLVIAQALRLANLLVRLVIDHDLAALPELIEAAQRDAGLSRRRLNAIVDSLQGRVAELAAACEVDLAPGGDFRATLLKAHARLSLVAEGGVARGLDADDPEERFAAELLAETRRLSAALRVFLAGGTGPRTDAAADENRARPRGPHGPTRPAGERLVAAAAASAARCRETRKPLTLAIVSLEAMAGGAQTDVVALRLWIGQSPLAGDLAAATWVPLDGDRVGVLIEGVERVAAARLWSEAAALLLERTPVRLDAGVAVVAAVPSGFDASRLVEAAERCLGAAASVASPTVKSIEVF